MRSLSSAGLVFLLWLGPEMAQGSLILEGSIEAARAGIGSRPTLLTIRGPGASSTASGCVGWNGFADFVGPSACAGTGSAGGNEYTGARQSRTLTLFETGIASADDLRIVFNPLEPKGDGITLVNLVLRVFSPAGTVLYTSGPFTAAVVISSTPSRGNTEFVFRLDEADLGSVPALAFSNARNRVGLAATVAGAAGGPESFWVTSRDTHSYGEVFETPSLVLVASGLLLAAILLRRRLGF